MNVRVVAQITSPGLKETDNAGYSANPFWIRSELEESGGSRFHEDAIEGFLIGAGKNTQPAGQSEGDQEMSDRQEFIELFLKPGSSGIVTAFGAMAVFAGVIAVASFIAGMAAIELTA